MESKPEKSQPQRRRRKLDESKQAEICGAIGVGASLRSAARMAGCSSSAIVKAYRRDPVFRERMQRAYLRREFVPLQAVQAAAAKNRWAAAWLLERMDPKEYVRRKPDTMTKEEVKAMLQRIADYLAAGLTPEKRREIGRMIGKMSRSDQRSAWAEDDVEGLRRPRSSAKSPAENLRAAPNPPAEQSR